MPISLEDTVKKAKARDIKMIPTNFIGGTKNSNGDKFEIDEKEYLVKKCPSDHNPTVPLKKDPIEHTLIKNTAIIAPYEKIAW